MSRAIAQRSVTTSPNGTVSATVTNDATPGTYNLTNIQLAQPESLISSGFASASSSLGAGSLTIQVGSGPAVTVNIASGQDNLTGIASAINQANAGVQATIVYDGSSYHLSLTGDSTGTAGAFTVTGSGGLAGFSSGVQGSGLSADRSRNRRQLFAQRHPNHQQLKHGLRRRPGTDAKFNGERQPPP